MPCPRAARTTACPNPRCASPRPRVRGRAPGRAALVALDEPGPRGVYRRGEGGRLEGVGVGEGEIYRIRLNVGVEVLHDLPLDQLGGGVGAAAVVGELEVRAARDLRSHEVVLVEVRALERRGIVLTDELFSRLAIQSRIKLKERRV